MKKLLVLAFLLVAAPARADRDGIGLGVFLGQPSGLDIKIGLERRSALDIVIGANRFDEPRVSYGHVQYLATLGVARGQSVNVPFRLGVGGAVLALGEDTTFAARVPFQLGLRFRRSPLEIYGEIAFVVVFVDDTDTDVDGGLGLRVYF